MNVFLSDEQVGVCLLVRDQIQKDASLQAILQYVLKIVSDYSHSLEDDHDLLIAYIKEVHAEMLKSIVLVRAGIYHITDRHTDQRIIRDRSLGAVRLCARVSECVRVRVRASRNDIISNSRSRSWFVELAGSGGSVSRGGPGLDPPSLLERKTR